MIMTVAVLLFVSACAGNKAVKTPLTPPGLASENSLTDTWMFGDCNVAYHKSGTGEPMVFLHNGGADHRIWDFQVSFFSRTHTVYALDLPGFGESGHPKVPYTLDFYTRVLEGFIADNHLSSVTLVGNCIGSAASLNYASKHPENVRRLVLFNILTEDILKEGDYGYWRTISRIPGGKGCLGFLSPFVWMPDFYITSEMGKLYGSKGLAGEPDPEFLIHLRTLFKKPQEMPGLASILVNIHSYQAVAVPPENVALPPICVLWGEKNRVLPAKASRTLTEAYRFNEFHVIEGTGHFLMRERHEDVNGIMASFMDSPLQIR
jgi:pimeloyl-ACP methyl ester carboxylesterase